MYFYLLCHLQLHEFLGVELLVGVGRLLLLVGRHVRVALLALAHNVVLKREKNKKIGGKSRHGAGV